MQISQEINVYQIKKTETGWKQDLEVAHHYHLVDKFVVVH